MRVAARAATTAAAAAPLLLAASLVVATLLGACTRDRARDAAVATNSTSSTTPAAAVRVDTTTATVATATSTVVPVVDTLARDAGRGDTLAAPLAVTEDARAVCDSVAAVWRAIPRSVVQRAESLVTAREAEEVSGAGDQRYGVQRRFPSCTVAASRAEGLDSTMQLRRFWPARGWTEIWKLAADGVDGDMLTYQRGLVRCHVWQQWDGGDDSDSTYVPSPDYGETTVCWRHRRPIAVLDTLHQEP